jgi:hypothetical protein
MSNKHQDRIENILGIWAEDAHAKRHLTLAGIIDGCVQRLADKGSMTPKQCAWFMDQCDKLRSPADRATQDAVADLMEAGGTLEQRKAESEVKERVKSLREAAQTQQISRFHSLFEQSDTAEVLDAIEHGVRTVRQRL